tara:strand:- start:8829 stop:9392 length:564 start_codon:yes stop_codon:yes gene_type:complete
MQIEQIAIGDVMPYENNPRDITRSAIDTVKQSIVEFGWRQPLVVDKDMVLVVGHTRLLAAQELGLAEVPVHIAEDMTGAQARAYRLADNKTGEFSGWLDDLLAVELADVLDSGLDIDALGFTDSPLPEGFVPYVEPDTGGAVADVTGDDIINAQDGLSNRHVSGESTLVEVICPHCAENFEIDRSAL